MSNVEFHFFAKQEKGANVILSDTRGIYEDCCPGKTTIYKWSGLFKSGMESLNDDERPERPSNVSTHEIVMT